jgi:Beta-galactosidase trimerisation domain
MGRLSEAANCARLRPACATPARKSCLPAGRASRWAIIAAATYLWSVLPLLAEDTSQLAAPWMRHARVAGAELFAQMTAVEIEKNLAALEAQNVSVIEADSDLSRFLTNDQFQAELALMRRYVEAAHRRGMRVVWYYPTLEILSPNARNNKRSVSQLFPTWLQRGLDGEPNIFFGAKRGSAGDHRVHWVDPDTESAWISLYSPYIDVIIDRTKKIAATGVDGIWLDVPIYNDIGAEWADASAGAAAKFRADTRMEMPKSEDWESPAWRRWIAWRYKEISNFILRVRDAARSVADDIVIVVEIVSLDYGAATKLGLDGSSLKTAAGVIPVWEVDVLSDNSAMREAKPDDWICLIGMSKFAKAAAGNKPSWMFTYGKEQDDALLVMAEALAAGNNPYETKIPQMMTTVGAAYRRRMFAWIKQEERRLFESASAARVAVYFSPESRDYVDMAGGLGLFATTDSKDDLWWSIDPEHSVYALTYLAEYRGIIKWLIHNHIPFDIVVRPDAAELSRYQAVIAPSLAAIGEREARLLDQYAAKGGHLVVTGPKPAALDEFGNQRRVPMLKSLVPWDWRRKSAAAYARSGAGAALYTEELVGESYLKSNSDAASRVIRELIGQHARSPIETNAGKAVHMELRKSGDELLLHLINPERIWNTSAPQKQDVTVRLELPPGVTVDNVHVTSPEPSEAAANDDNKDAHTGSLKTAGPDPAPSGATVAAGGAGQTARLDFTVKGNHVAFTVPLQAYAMVVIATKPTVVATAKPAPAPMAKPVSVPTTKPRVATTGRRR